MASVAQIKMMRERCFHNIRVGAQAFELEVMIYGERLGDRQPILMFNSIEFAMPPSQATCEALWDAGFQVVFARRPGFGASSPLPAQLMTQRFIAQGITAMTEAAMLHALTRTLNLKNIILLAIGSANPACYRLVHMAAPFQRVIFVNPTFNQDILPIFRPPWFQTMLRQMISSESGLRVAEAGMKLLIKRDPISFYETILKKSPGDLDYAQANLDDYDQAGALALEISGSTLFYDGITSITHDPLLKDGYFEGVDAAILIGNEATSYWQQEMTKEADRLNLPLFYAPRGDIFCAHASPEIIIEIARKPVLREVGVAAQTG